MRAANGAWVTQARNEESHPSPVVLIEYSPISRRFAIRFGEGALIDLYDSPELSHTVDWLNAQACSLTRDVAHGLPVDAKALSWRDGLLRHSSAINARRTLSQVSQETVEIVAGFPDATVTTVRRPTPPESGGYSWDATVTPRGGLGPRLGRVRWFPSDGVLAFHYPGLTGQETISASNIGRPMNFEPNAAWGTTQAFAFLYYLRQRERLHKSLSNSGPRLVKAWAQPMTRLVQDEGDGCTFLWWLNDTLFRPCCDAHDWCYVTGPCSMGSWLSWTMLWPVWQCTMCNLAVAGCFYSTACVYLGGIFCI